MTNIYEDSREKINALLKWYSENKGNRNEATTRLHLIDEILFECLGWDKRSDCIAEETHDGTYADFTLLCPRRMIIVEAKKEGIYFEIPSNYGNRDYKLLTLFKDIPDLGKAILQVSSYCQDRGVPIAIITNGYQYISFIGSRQDGLPPLDGNAIVFESLEEIVKNFAQFWKIFSKPGISDQNLIKKLMGDKFEHLPKKLSQIIRPFPGNKDRNIIQTDLQILSDLVIEDLSRTDELEEPFLKACYCQSGALSQYALISKSILSQKYSALFPEKTSSPTIASAVNKKGLSEDLVQESYSKRPVLLTSS